MCRPRSDRFSFWINQAIRVGTKFKLDGSVVIPVFNVELRVREALERVISLSFVKAVIVVDDGSTGASLEVLSKLDEPRL